MSEEKRPGLEEFRFSPRPNKANEINWQPWGPKPFEIADTQSKPLLLAISAVWCHWCHVMDEQGYSREDIIQLINESFIPMRVDRDRRPDIDRRYNMGGWPTICLLTPAGDVITGATYVPPGPLKNVFEKVLEYFAEDRAGLEAEIAATKEASQKAMDENLPKPPEKAHWPIVGDHVASALVQTFDQKHGGWGKAPKFPNVDAIEYALAMYDTTGDSKWLHMARMSADGMRNGQIYDWEAGGFFRYAQTDHWSDPHYEKMLEDNANLLRVNLKLYSVTGIDAYRYTAKSIMSYMESTLYQPDTGVFGGSQDADEEYYKHNLEERANLEAPFVDPTIYTDWNAIAASAYLYAADVLNDKHAQEVGLKALNFLWDNCFQDNFGVYHYWDGEPKVWGLLNDHTMLGSAMLDAYEITEDPSYLTKALRLGERIKWAFNDTEGDGGFFDTAANRPAEGALKDRIKVLSENSWTAIFLDRLAEFTENEDDKAELNNIVTKTLLHFVPTFMPYGVQAAIYGIAVERLIDSRPM